MTHIITSALGNLLGHIPPHTWFLLWVAFYVAGTLLLLWALSLVKTVMGWPGVIVVLLAVTYCFAYTRGTLHQSLNPFDNPQAAIIEVLK